MANKDGGLFAHGALARNGAKWWVMMATRRQWTWERTLTATKQQMKEP